MLVFAAHLAVIWIIAFTANVAMYFGGGWAITWMNRRHPERKIQPLRDGMKRARAEIKESLLSIAVTSFCLSLAIALSIFGYTLWTPWEGIIGAAAGLLVLILLYDAWFYWSHRLLHTKPFYRFHHWHHRSVAPTVWSSDSQTAVETGMIQGFMVVATVLLPISPLALVAHRIYDHFNGQLGHCGYEYFAGKGARFPSPMVCTGFHDQHHELFTYNYANYFSLWDRICGTLHPAYDGEVARGESKLPAE